MSGVDYDAEFKAILCHKNSILDALGSLLFGMNMYNKGLQFNYVFNSLSGNGSRRYTQADLYALNNLAVMGKTGGDAMYNHVIDKEFICLINHANTYVSAIVATKMARKALSDGRSYIYTFNIKGSGHKNYNQKAIITLDDEASAMSNCCPLDDQDCITRCCEHFGCSA